MKRGSLFLFVLTVFLITTHGSALAFKSPLRFGWVTGWDENNAVILHTKNGGRKWVLQGKWAGYEGNDISAVDRQTAWAALGSTDLSSGIILHTTNGGTTWTEQTLPEGVDGGIKGIKGLTRHEAWAVSLGGTILHTTDGGKVWNSMPHPDIPIIEVNRMDAIGYRDVRDADRSGKNTGMIHANVWIADEFGEDDGHLGMIHTLYNGDIWRQESIPCIVYPCHVHMVSAYSPKVVWAAAWGDGTLYRTVDGGETWDGIDAGIGGNDIDDMCAYSADALWFVQFQGSPEATGYIFHVSLEDGEPVKEYFQPIPEYKYEGLTCVNDQTAVVVGYTYLSPDPPLQKGIILVTNDGGKNWEIQPTPVDDVSFWKVSFVGARR
jgi:photosystem II stability/assembly factor-like uncharacterized protein